MVSWLVAKEIGAKGLDAVKSIPAPIWYGLAAAVVVFVGLWQINSYGDRRYTQGQVDLLAEQAVSQAELEDKQVVVTEKIVTEYVDRIEYIEVAGETIIKKVPVYVTVVDDSRCVINSGFVRLWNEANSDKVSDSTAGADGAASAVVLSDVATQKGREATLCKVTEQRLASLQDWVREQAVLWKEHQR